MNIFQTCGPKSYEARIRFSIKLARQPVGTTVGFCPENKKKNFFVYQQGYLNTTLENPKTYALFP